MDEGGGRTNYYRVSVPGKAAYTEPGEVWTDPALPRIQIRGSSLNDILGIGGEHRVLVHSAEVLFAAVNAFGTTGADVYLQSASTPRAGVCAHVKPG